MFWKETIFVEAMSCPSGRYLPSDQRYGCSPEPNFPPLLAFESYESSSLSCCGYHLETFEAPNGTKQIL